MTIQEAVERCIGYQDNNMPLVFNIYDETPGTIWGLLYRTFDIDDLVVHMFNLDMLNYDVKQIRSRVQNWSFDPDWDGSYHMVVDISVRNCIKER